MYCETYHCKMTDAACVARQKNAARGKWNSGAGAVDINCKDCAQGKAIAAAIDPAVVDRYSRDLRQVRNRARDRKFGGEKKENTAMTVKKKAPEGMKICSRKECAHQGAPQPLDDFDNLKTAVDGKQNHCKDCRRAYQRALSKKKWAEKKAQKVKEQAREKTQASAGTTEEKAEKGAPPKDKPDAYADITIMPGQKPDTQLATLFDNNELTLQRLHWLAYRERRTPLDQIFAMIEQATPELDPNREVSDALRPRP